MSIAGYFKSRPELRMSQGDDSIGIKFEGPVLNGDQSVQQGLEYPNSESFPMKGESGHLISLFRLTSDYNIWKNKLRPGKFGPAGVPKK
jgi:hypothetical protein